MAQPPTTPSSGGAAKPKEDLSDSLKTMLATFRSATSISASVAALSPLLAPKVSSSVRREPLFEEGIAALIQRSMEESIVPSDRLVALSGLLLVRSLKAPFDAQVRPLIDQLLSTELPSLDLLDDAEAKPRVLDAIAEKRPKWAWEYVIRHAVRDRMPQKTRIAALKAALATGDDLSQTVHGIATEIEQGSKSIATLTYVRLVRAILTDFEEVLDTSEIVAGEDPIGGLTRIAEGLRNHNIRTLNAGEITDTGEACAKLLRKIIAMRLRNAMDARSFAPICVLRSACGNMWNAAVDRGRSLSALRIDVAEALFIRAQSSIPDRGLRAALESLCSGDHAFEQELDRLSREPGLPVDMQHWFSGEKVDIPEPVAHSIQQLTEESERDLVVQILVRMSRIEDFHTNPSPSSPVMKDLVDELLDSVRSLARMRGLRVVGRLGDVVPFDPNRHRVIDIPATGVTIVRLLSPLIVHDSSSGRPIVVLPAAVVAVPDTFERG